MIDHKSLLKLPATASKLAVTTRFVICPSCRTVCYAKRSSTCQARRHQKERGSALNWGYNSVHIRKHKGQRDADHNNAHRETKNQVQQKHCGYVQMRCVDRGGLACGWRGRERFVASGFCAGAHGQPTTNWLSAGRRVGFTTSTAVAQAVSSPTQV